VHHPRKTIQWLAFFRGGCNGTEAGVHGRRSKGLRTGDAKKFATRDTVEKSSVCWHGFGCLMSVKDLLKTD
jgi:hypothetical protein